MTGLELDSTYGSDTGKHEGVAGWLLLFCVALTVITPASALLQVGHVIPRLLRTHNPRRRILWTVFIAMYLSLGAAALVTGIRLWTVRRGAVRMAQLWLLLMLCLNVSYFFLWLMLFAHARTDPVTKVAWDHIVGPLIPFCLWTAYLRYSKRVRNTYRHADQSV